MDDDFDNYAPARGCALVVFLSALLWCCVGVALVWVVLR